MDQVYICEELRECKLNEILTQKRRQQLHANSHELRQLERQFQSALVFKQLEEQQKSIARRKEDEFYTKQEENSKFAVECDLNRKSIRDQQEQKKKKKDILLGMLKSQINDMKEKRRIEFEHIKKDCDKMERQRKQHQVDRITELKVAKLIREKYISEMEESYRDIKLKQQLEKEKNALDTERNLAYQQKCENLKFQVVEEKKRIQREKEELRHFVGQQLGKLNREKAKRENLFLTLLIEERKAKDDEHYKEELIKQIKEREKIRLDIKNFCQEIKGQKEGQFKEEEEKFLAQHVRYLEERDRLEHLSDEKRRRKKMEHKKALREMIETRRCQKANKIAAQIVEFEKLLNDGKKSNQLIEEERIRMLNAIPKELLRYLPPGVLRSSDREFITLPEQKI